MCSLSLSVWVCERIQYSNHHLASSGWIISSIPRSDRSLLVVAAACDAVISLWCACGASAAIFIINIQYIVIILARV